MQILRLLILLIFIFPISNLTAQEQMRMLHYNILLYGNPFACDESNNNTDSKDENLKFLLDELQPDIFTINELGSGYYGDRILDDVLNQDGTSYWQKANPSNTSWDSGIVNMLYYNSDKYTLVEQQLRDQSPAGTYLTRVVDMYTLYSNSTALTQDTVFVNVLVAHLHSSDQNMREQMCLAMMEMVKEKGEGNYILSGDFNMDSSNESGFQVLINNEDAEFNFYDPANALGTWHNNSSFAHVHSQSTHVSGGGGCYAGGGMDDRFDLSLISAPVVDGSFGLKYIEDSYKAYGNDGDNYNASLHIENNGVISADLATALYFISDHLPILTEYELGTSVGIANENMDEPLFSLAWTEDQITISNPLFSAMHIKVYDTNGRELLSQNSSQENALVDISNLSPAVYLLSISDQTNARMQSNRFVKLDR